MNFIKASAYAFGKLFTVMILAATFLFGMVGMVYLSLQGDEVKVPEIVGKDFVNSEKELAALGLKIKRRADRYSDEKMNTVLEQLPKSGETVKTGQMILVVVSKEKPPGKDIDTIKQDDEQEEIDKIEELISDKPKKSEKNNDNSNKKKTTKTRDVIADVPDDKTSTDASGTKGADGEKNSNKDDKSGQADKPIQPKAGEKPGDGKPADPRKPADSSTKPKKTPVSADTRPRRTPQP